MKRVLRKKTKLNKGVFVRKAIPYMYVAPMLLLLMIFSLWPFIQSVITSFYRDDGMLVREFVGFKNYLEILFEDQMFWKSLKVLFYLFLGMNLCCLFPVIAAKMTCMLRSEKLQSIVRSIFTITTVVPSVVNLMIWKFIYYPGFGVVARIMDFFGKEYTSLLGNEATVIPAIIMIGFPWVSGMTYLMYCATLKGIDCSIYEAAVIDGCSEWQIFKNIEVPIIAPTFLNFYVLGFIGQFHDYERFLILTGGGPNGATTTPALYMYNTAFGDAGSAQYGYASAIAMLLFIITFTLTRVIQKRGDN